MRDAEEVTTAMKKASQSSQSARAGSEEVVTAATRWAAVLSSAEERPVEGRRAWMGAKKGLPPGFSTMVVMKYESGEFLCLDLDLD